MLYNRYVKRLNNRVDIGSGLYDADSVQNLEGYEQETESKQFRFQSAKAVSTRCSCCIPVIRLSALVELPFKAGNRSRLHPGCLKPDSASGIFFALNPETASGHSGAGTWTRPLRWFNLSLAARLNGPSRPQRNGAPSAPVEQKENERALCVDNWKSCYMGFITCTV